MMYGHDQPYQHVCLRNHNDTVKTSDTVLRKICTSHFIERVGKGYSRFYCENELEAEQNCNILTSPAPPDIAVCHSRSPGLLNQRPQGPLRWVLFSQPHLVTNGSGLQTGLQTN